MMDGLSTPDPPAPERADPRGGAGAGSAADPLWWFRDLRQAAQPTRVVRRRWNRPQMALDALACLAISTLVFSQARTEALFGNWGFYNKVPLGPPVLWALLVNIVGTAGLGLLAVQAVRHIRRRAWRCLAAVGAAATVLAALNFVRLTHEIVERWADAVGAPWILALTAAILAAAFGWPDRALLAVRIAALITSPLAILTVGHALWMFVEVSAGPVWRRADPAPLSRTAPSLRRVVWLVFEELDQRTAFETRPAGLELPELDRLRRESLWADAARPPAGTPEVSMPALITGRPVVSVTPLNPNDLELAFR